MWKHTIQEGLFGLLSWPAAGVFVHCWSGLLSPICCYSLAWKQDRERFHTYTHWPLINKSDQGPFPHIHTTQMKTKAIHTHVHIEPNHRNIPELTLVDLNHTSCPSGSDLTTQFFVYQSRQPIVMSQWCYTWSDGCSPVASSLNTRRLVPISCSLFFFFTTRISKHYCPKLVI